MNLKKLMILLVSRISPVLEVFEQRELQLIRIRTCTKQQVEHRLKIKK